MTETRRINRLIPIGVWALSILACGAAANRVWAQAGLPYSIDPPEGSVAFGASVASGGDVDGDNLPDIFVADPEYANGSGVVGRWFIYSGADGSLIWSVTGDRVCQPFSGFDVVGAFVQDLDGDGRAEVIVGVPNADGARGAAYVYSGRTGDLLYQFAGAAQYDQLGREVTGLGDLNNDHIPEFALITSAQDPGSVVVYDGATGQQLYRAPDSLEPPRRVRSIGDLDDDQVSDLIVGTRFVPQGNGGYRGEVQAVSGRTGNLIWSNLREGYLFGWTIATGADLTGDNVPDILSRWSSTFQAEAIVLISGATGETVAIEPALYGGVFWGTAMALADVNADGVVDLVGMRLQLQQFAADVVNPLNRRILHWVEGPAPAGGFLYYHGNEMAVSDVNGDGAADFIVGSYGNGVRVFGGARLLLNFEQRRRDYNITPGQSYDFTVGGGQPGRVMHLLGSITGNGCTFIQQLGICIDLDQRIYNLGSAVSDSERVAHFTLDVPLNIPHGPAWLQAVDPADPMRGAIKSNVMRLDVVD